MLADRPKTDTITDFIAQDLRDRILANRPLPAKLTLTALAHHYRVSLTPVRLAINTLLLEKLLRKRENGRIEINSASTHRAERKPKTSEVQPPPTPRDWETALAQEVIVRSLTGNDDYLREEAMSQRFGIGRTVLRQVFNRLAGKGLLEHKPRCGWRIRIFNEEDMRAYLVAREALELAALDLARPHLVAADLQRMLEKNAPGSDTSPRLDNHLHRYLIEKSGNGYIRDFFDRSGLYYTMLFDFAAPEASVVSEMAAQHREILAALLAEDWDGAREALARHIRAQVPIVRRLLEKISAEGLANRAGRNTE